MSRSLRRLSGLTLPVLFCTSFAAQAEDATVNRLLASQCAQCHGTNGYALGGFDDLAGEEAKDLFEDLTDMKEEDRPENIMDHQALGYSDAQIRRIASFYATLPEDQSGGAGDSREDEPEEREEREEREEH